MLRVLIYTCSVQGRLGNTPLSTETLTGYRATRERYLDSSEQRPELHSQRLLIRVGVISLKRRKDGSLVHVVERTLSLQRCDKIVKKNKDGSEAVGVCG